MTAGELHPKFFKARSVPWNEAEFVIYRGFRLVYTSSRGKVLTVHLPGGAEVDPTSLYGATMPRMIRGPVPG